MRSFFAFLALMPSVVWAQTAAGNSVAGSSPYASLLPLLAIFFVFYFLLIKPQQKRMKEHQAVLAALKKGDEVVTGGGIVGKITKAGEGSEITVEIAKGVEVVVLKATVSSVVDRSPKPAIITGNKKNSPVKNDNTIVKKDQIANDN